MDTKTYLLIIKNINNLNVFRYRIEMNKTLYVKNMMFTKLVNKLMFYFLNIFINSLAICAEFFNYLI